MMQSILVPLDGSTQAERVVPFVSRLAHLASAKVICLRARGAREPETPVSSLLPSLAYLQSRGVEAEALLPAIDTEDHRTVAHIIAGAARAARSALIVMTTRGRTGVDHWERDSVTAHVVRHAPVPVLLVGPGAQPRWPEVRPLRILALLDGTTEADGVLAPVTTLAATARAEVILLRVVGAHRYALAGASPFLVADSDEELAESRLHLEAAATRLRLAGIPVRVYAAEGLPARTANVVAHAEDADIVALHKRNSAAGIVLDTFVAGTLERETVPLLVVPAPATPLAQ